MYVESVRVRENEKANASGMLYKKTEEEKISLF